MAILILVIISSAVICTPSAVVLKCFPFFSKILLTCNSGMRVHHYHQVELTTAMIPFLELNSCMAVLCNALENSCEVSVSEKVDPDEDGTPWQHNYVSF